MTSCRLDEVGGGCLAGRMGRGVGWSRRGVRVMRRGMPVWMGLAVFLRRSSWSDLERTVTGKLARLIIAVGGRGLDNPGCSIAWDSSILLQKQFCIIPLSMLVWVAAVSRVNWT